MNQEGPGCVPLCMAPAAPARMCRQVCSSLFEGFHSFTFRYQHSPNLLPLPAPCRAPLNAPRVSTGPALTANNSA
jgi:hypothetical protein